MLAFPLSWFFYVYVFQIKYFDFLNFLAVFVLLGIGVDDVYIFADTWMQSRLLFQNDMPARMHHTWKGSAVTMGITSVTDLIAFLLLLAAYVPPIRYFGAFVACVIISNYLLVLTWFPAIVYIHSLLGLEDSCLPHCSIALLCASGPKETVCTEHVSHDVARAATRRA